MNVNLKRSSNYNTAPTTNNKRTKQTYNRPQGNIESKLNLLNL